MVSGGPSLVSVWADHKDRVESEPPTTSISPSAEKSTDCTTPLVTTNWPMTDRKGVGVEGLNSAVDGADYQGAPVS